MQASPVAFLTLTGRLADQAITFILDITRSELLRFARSNSVIFLMPQENGVFSLLTSYVIQRCLELSPNLAEVVGFEPTIQESKSWVLPLHNTSM